MQVNDHAARCAESERLAEPAAGSASCASRLVWMPPSPRDPSPRLDRRPLTYVTIESRIDRDGRGRLPLRPTVPTPAQHPSRFPPKSRKPGRRRQAIGHRAFITPRFIVSNAVEHGDDSAMWDLTRAALRSSSQTPSDDVRNRRSPSHHGDATHFEPALDAAKFSERGEPSPAGTRLIGSSDRGQRIHPVMAPC